MPPLLVATILATAVPPVNRWGANTWPSERRVSLISVEQLVSPAAHVRSA